MRRIFRAQPSWPGGQLGFCVTLWREYPGGHYVLVRIRYFFGAKALRMHAAWLHQLQEGLL